MFSAGKDNITMNEKKRNVKPQTNIKQHSCDSIRIVYRLHVYTSSVKRFTYLHTLIKKKVRCITNQMRCEDFEVYIVLVSEYM
jgi:hypothetical protein